MEELTLSLKEAVKEYLRLMREAPTERDDPDYQRSIAILKQYGPWHIETTGLEAYCGRCGTKGHDIKVWQDGEVIAYFQAPEPHTCEETC